MSEHPMLTLEMVRPMAVEIVSDRPDHVYQLQSTTGECKYTQGGSPDCLIGQILFRLGYSIEDLERFDICYLGTDHGTDIASLINYGFVSADDSAREYMSILQANQDLGVTWGDALKRAESSLGETIDE